MNERERQRENGASAYAIGQPTKLVNRYYYVRVQARNLAVISVSRANIGADFPPPGGQNIYLLFNVAAGGEGEGEEGGGGPRRIL